MTQTVYLDRLDDLGAKVVASVGSQPGPIGGDGWVVVSEIPTARLQAGRQYVFLVNGKVGNFARSGSFPSAGVVQLCLGDASGTQHPDFLIEIGFGAQLAAGEGLPFSFMLVCSSAVVDALYGATWGNAFPLQLLGRIYRRGDPATYTGSFEVTNLTWIWADLDSIPSGDQRVTRAATPVGLTFGATPVGIAQSTTPLPGSDGDIWIHFWSIAYRPGVGTMPAFQVGTALAPGYASFDVKHGAGGELGLGHTGTTTYGVRHIWGSFFVEPKLGDSYPTLLGRDARSGAQATGLHRFDCFSLRLTELQAVFFDHSSSEPAQTAWLDSASDRSVFFPLEIPAQGRTWAPWTFATGLPSVTGPCDGFLMDNNGNTLWASLDLLRMSDGQEQVPTFAAAAEGLGAGNPGVQYRALWLERSATTPIRRTVRDIYLATFYPIRDPDNQPPDPGAVGDPVEIVPGTEGPGTGSLLDPPLPPNVEQLEGLELSRNQIVGATGYRRSWATFVAMRASVPLTWGPVTRAQRDALLEFLRAHRTFRLTLVGASAPIAVSSTDRPSSRQIDHLRWDVSVTVAELVYVDP